MVEESRIEIGKWKFENGKRDPWWLRRDPKLTVEESEELRRRKQGCRTPRWRIEREGG
jgi:hypothetical protein